MIDRFQFHVLIIIAVLNCDPPVFAQETPQAIQAFLTMHCCACHAGKSAEAGFDIEQLADTILSEANVHRWTQLFDRIHENEMPPPEESELDASDRRTFLNETGNWIRSNQKALFESEGRVRGRRLTNLQLERTLHDLLGIDIPLANRMPAEPRSGGFTTVADGQAMSHFQLREHVNVVDDALDEAFRRALEGPDERSQSFSARDISRKGRRRTREPELIDGSAVTWSSKLAFYGRIPATTATREGWYRFKLRVKSLKQPAEGGVWCTVRAGQCISSAPLLAWVAAFEATPDAKQVEFEAWLPRGHMLEIRPGDATLKTARFQGGQVGNGEGGPQNVPGVAIESVEMERFHRGPSNDKIHKLLLGDENALLSHSKKNKIVDQETADPATAETVTSLLVRFARRVFRRPTSEDEIAPYVAIALKNLGQTHDLSTALRTGYRAILCSPRFLYFREQPGQLDDFAIASRLSYFLWNRMPDATLWRLAEQKKLAQNNILREQVDRMLSHPHGKNFVRDLANEWLEMNLIDFTEPDRRLYPGFDLVVQNSLLSETHAFLQAMVAENLDVGHLIDSDFAFLNSRLARYYDMEGVEGDELRRIPVSESSHRGGLLTHGSVLKITANGTTTSPVIRGVWVSEKLLGQHIPPPPENIPAIEPDIRGAKTIREMLAKHKENGNCAACHRKIDPPGFALENFDPSGRWRESYSNKKSVKQGSVGAEIDSSSKLPTGASFEDLVGFQSLILQDQPQLARNVAEKLLVYGTGAPIQFSDREDLERCVKQAAKDNFGFRSIIKEVVTSPIFLSK